MTDPVHHRWALKSRTSIGFSDDFLHGLRPGRTDSNAHRLAARCWRDRSRSPGGVGRRRVLLSSENPLEHHRHDRNGRTINTTNASHGFETDSRHPSDQREWERTASTSTRVGRPSRSFEARSSTRLSELPEGRVAHKQVAPRTAYSAVATHVTPSPQSLPIDMFLRDESSLLIRLANAGGANRFDLIMGSIGRATGQAD